MSDTNAGIGALRVLVLVVLVVGLAACGGSGGSASNGVETTGASSVSVVESSDGSETATSKPQTTEPQVTGNDGGDEFSVVMIVNADELAADAILKALEREGFNEFVREGSPDEGFDVYWPGLTMAEAIQGVEDVRVAPNLFGAFISKTESIP